MRVIVSQTVLPEDQSLVLPLGQYEVSDVKLLGRGGDRAVVTFLVTEGPHAGPRRRIAVILYHEGDEAEWN